MKIDLYPTIILTIMAICLFWICISLTVAGGSEIRPAIVSLTRQGCGRLMSK